MNRETISKIVKASGVTAGEIILVHFWGEDADKEIANDFVAAVAALGATPVLLQQARSINRDIFAYAKESCFDNRYFDLFSQFDAVLDVFAYQPIILGYQIDKEQMNLYRKYISQLFYQLMKCKRFTQIRMPTSANAAESALDPQDYILRMEKAYDIDYEALKSACMREADKMKSASKVAVHTGESSTLYLELTERTWHIDAGDGDLPCGELYIAPVEEKTDGEVFFSTFYLNDAKNTDVILQISAGEVCGSNHAEITKHFAELLKENRMVCELGIGMNPNISDLCGYTLLDEKMAGTFHIAVGDNHMFGGKNQANDHVDFVGFGRIEVMI